MKSKLSQLKACMAAGDIKGSGRRSTPVEAVIALLLRLEDTLIGSAPPENHPDIRYLYTKLKEANQ